MTSFPIEKFVTCFNGARDYYQLPAALNERSLLAKHVSDFYLPSAIAKFVKARGFMMGNRSNELLPINRIALSYEGILQNLQLRSSTKKLRTYDPYFLVDRALSLHAVNIANRGRHSLFLHSGYAYWAFERLDRGKRGLFQYHPHSNLVYELLERDYVQHPEVAYSFSHETDSRSPTLIRKERLNEWKLSDFAFCASSFTKSSLVAEGMDANRIFVIPYGADNIKPNAISARSKQSVCRFLFVGQGVQRKGLHHLLKAWKNLNLSDAHLTVVARKLDPGIAKLLDGKNIDFLPGASNIELSKLYDSSDVFVMPSLVEGFGLVYLEALKHGLPCIGTVNTGIPDLHLDEEFAVCSHPGESSDLEAKILDLYHRWRRNEIDKTRVRDCIKDKTWANHRQEIVDLLQIEAMHIT